MRPFSRIAVKALAAVLAYLISVQSALAAVQSVQVHSGMPVGAPSAVGAALQGGRLAPGSLSLSAVSLQSPSGVSLSVVPGVKPAAVLSAPVELPAPAAVSVAAPVAAAAPVLPAKVVPVSEAVANISQERIQPAAEAAAEAVQGLEKKSADGSKDAAQTQIDVLTGERRGADSGDVADPVPASPAPAAAKALQPASQQAQAPQAEVPPAKGSFTQVFKDPQRNKSFWRYVLGSIVYTFGIEMYVVGLPYLVSAFTKNSLRENNDPRAGVAEAVQTLVRENRNLARIAHWVAQAVGYATIPLFTRNTDGSLKWLPRAFWIRSAILGGIVTVFFASGVLSVSGALYALLGLIAVQSFFQGLSVTLESVGLARMMGDKSVTDSERMKANAILTFIASAVAIIGPAIAGQISMVKDLFGKTGVGGAFIYGIYALATGLAGLIYATVKIFGKKAESAAGGQAAEAKPAAEKLTFKGVLKGLWTSLRDGIKLIFKDRFFRTFMLLTLAISLFSDPLVFNVLPEYVENLIKANPGMVNAVLNVPVIGWFFKGMTSTPMGFFSLLVVFSSMGSIAGTLLLNPMRKLLDKLGFKSEESKTIPFYILAALEIPLFWLMISTPSLMVLPLYGLQTFVTGFGTMMIYALQQKKLGTYSGDQVNKILAAESFLGILAAILSTYLYGFVLTGIPIATALYIAAIATTVYGILRMASPWLFFSKADRQRRP